MNENGMCISKECYRINKCLQILLVIILTGLSYNTKIRKCWWMISDLRFNQFQLIHLKCAFFNALELTKSNGFVNSWLWIDDCFDFKINYKQSDALSLQQSANNDVYSVFKRNPIPYTCTKGEFWLKNKHI